MEPAERRDRHSDIDFETQARAADPNQPIGDSHARHFAA
jgi:hypothetical protein